MLFPGAVINTEITQSKFTGKPGGGGGYTLVVPALERPQKD